MEEISQGDNNNVINIQQTLAKKQEGNNCHTTISEAGIIINGNEGYLKTEHHPIGTKCMMDASVTSIAIIGSNGLTTPMIESITALGLGVTLFTSEIISNQ